MQLIFLTQSVDNLAFTHSHNMHNVWLNFKNNLKEIIILRFI